MENLRKRTMAGGGLPGQVASGSEAVALDVLFSSNDGSELIIIRDEENWPNSGYTPIGIVVVPGTHDRYGDGTCGIMSLVGMDWTNPESGIPVTSVSQLDDAYIGWGKHGARGYSIASTMGNYIFNATYMLYDGSNPLYYIPSQSNASSTDTSFHANYNCAEWPYAGSIPTPTNAASTLYMNTDGYVTATTGMAGCDFNGIRNTAAGYICNRQYDWNSNYSETQNEFGNYAHICTCKFKTLGTKSFYSVYRNITTNDPNYGTLNSTMDNTGFWYFPALGELSYLPRYRFEIDKTTDALNNKYNNVGTKMDSSYWSSTEYRSDTLNQACYISQPYGWLRTADKNSQMCVRAFLRFK